MSAEVAIALGVAGRVFANVACVQNPRLGAALVGVFDGILIHRSWITNTLFEPLILIILTAGLFFDYYQFEGVEGTITLLLGCGLGVVLADFGPDLWYEIGGEQLTREVSREMESLFGFVGDDSTSDRDDRSEVGSVISSSTKASASTHRTAHSVATGTSLTVRPSRPHQPARRPASTITRLSRVTFDESSISQSQSSDEDFETDAGHETAGLTTEFALEGDAASESVPPSATGMDDLYMEPSTSNGSTHTRVRSRPPSILRRLEIPVPAPPMPVPLNASSHNRSRSASRTRLTSDGETTPRASAPPAEFSPRPPSMSGPPPPPLFPEPELSYTYVQPPPAILPAPASQDISSPISFPEPVHITEEHEPSRLSRMLNVPIVDPHEPEEDAESPESAGLWITPVPNSRRSRSSSPAGPRPQPPLKAEPPPPPPAYAFGGEQCISENIEDSTVDVRDLDKKTAVERIEEAWQVVEKKRHKRLNILVRHDDDELQSRKNTNFHLMEDLESLRFNTKVRPGIIIITSRSRR